MSKKLYKVPFAFTLAGVLLVAADSPEEAHDTCRDRMLFDGSNLPESNVFWEEGDPVVETKVDINDPQITSPTEVTDETEKKDLVEAYGMELDDDGEGLEGLDEGDDEDEDEEPADEADAKRA